ncbi:BMP family ABC transporter substrate-binding protein [Halobacillus fulvus]|nr:BMP family ABC transporter substrate-binding protein [Halobacillus fulvus]
MLVETTIHDQAWGQKGYKGLQAIQEEYDLDVYIKEGVQSYADTFQSVEELSSQGVNVVFGHSNVYGNHFQQLHQSFPDIHFIYFNGEFTAENVTSLNFSAQAMGFFGGMVAGEMTETDQVGLIGVFEWQPEIEGFYEGVKYQNPEADIELAFTNSWEDKDYAMTVYERMKNQGADVFYPAGDLFNIPLINQIRKDGYYAIGYVSDQSSVAENTVLTSTVQKVDVVYKLAMERLMNDELPGKSVTFDFQEGAIAMGEYSPNVPDDLRQQVSQAVDNYIETGSLPNE